MVQPILQSTLRCGTDTPGHSPDFHPPTGVESSNALIASPDTVSTLGQSRRLFWSGITCCYWGNAILEYDETQAGRSRSDSVRGPGTEGEEIVS